MQARIFKGFASNHSSSKYQVKFWIFGSEASGAILAAQMAVRELRIRVLFTAISGCFRLFVTLPLRSKI